MLLIGHRGARLKNTENTLSSFITAIKKGADAVELDIQLTQDGEIVVIHDPTIDRTTNGCGFVRDLLLKDLQKFKTKEGDKIPTLKEVFELCKGKLDILVEIKSTGLCTPLAKLFKSMNMSKHVIVQSFLHYELKKYRDIDSKTRTAIILDEIWLDGNVLNEYLASIKSNGAVINYQGISDNMIEKLHAENRFIYAWNVEEITKSQIKKRKIDGRIKAL